MNLSNTMCFGVPPSCTLLAGAGFDYVILPQGCDEIGVAGAVQGEAVRMVKARTVDALALADAEIVLEGYGNPRDRRFETAESEETGEQGNIIFILNGLVIWGRLTRHPPSTVQLLQCGNPSQSQLHLFLASICWMRRTLTP